MLSLTAALVMKVGFHFEEKWVGERQLEQGGWCRSRSAMMRAMARRLSAPPS